MKAEYRGEPHGQMGGPRAARPFSALAHSLKLW